MAISQLGVGTTATDEQPKSEARRAFLLQMYTECSGHLDRHVSSVWECLAVLAAAVAAVTVDSEKVVFDFAIAIAASVCVWFAASSIDASSWFNRNITIISNIERLFLERGDATLVHRYFLPPHRAPKMISHFRIHLALACLVGTLLILLHAHLRVLPVLGALSLEYWSRMLPLVIGSVGLVGLPSLACHYKSEQNLDNTATPGKQI